MMKIKKSLTALEGFSSTLAFAILVLISVGFAFDVYDFLENPEEYINVYQLDITKKNWKWDYLANTIMIALIPICGVIFYCFSFEKMENKTLKILRGIITFVFFGCLFYGFYQWFLTSFDH